MAVPEEDPRAPQRLANGDMPFMFYDGTWWYFIGGNPQALRAKSTTVYGFHGRNGYELAKANLAGSALGLEGASAVAAIWGRVEGIPPPKGKDKPAAKKTWSELSESTKRGYRGKMRTQLGLTTDAEYARYYETARDLSWLRRHPTKRVRMTPPKIGAMRATHDYMVVWPQ